MRRTSVIVHGHYYQPPREDPRTDQVPLEPSAAPFHDWNERILAECYRPVTEARILDEEGRIRDVVNALEWMSWDGGPTLMRWLRREAPRTYAAFLESDRRSALRLGFGNAIAAPYHHVILPLASRRDKVTEVRWGIEDFRRRFGREPEGMWLPETAVDTETLDVLAQEGIAFTIVAPGQVETPPADGAAGRVELGGGRSIAVFVYDGRLSHDIAFGALLGDSRRWIGAVGDAAADPGRGLVSMATDGETFGHHHRWADMALAAALAGFEAREDLRLENFASYLHRNPPREDVRLVEPSAWSCAHGVERWRSDCGCKIEPHVPSSQAWRGVLREALEALATTIHAGYALEAGRHFDDVWAARDAFGRTLDAGDGARHAFVMERAERPPANEAERDALLAWLDAEQDAMRMFTSCGWFFDDLARLEPMQVLRYAAHAIDLIGGRGGPVERRLRAALAGAISNDPAAGDGRRLWDERIRGTLPVEELGSVEEIVWRAGPGAHGQDAPGTTDAGAVRTVVARGPAPEAPTDGRDTPLVAAVRTFLRAPGPAAARLVTDRARALGPADGDERVAAQSAFARSVPRSAGAPDGPVRDVARALDVGERFFERPTLGGTGPIGFVFGLHLHQPVGNFDHVFRSHVDDVYLPLLDRLAERDVLPLTLHVSGPLLEWLEANGHPFLDRVGRLAADGSVELLLSGMYEPVLPALSRGERVEQIQWMRDWLHRRFGVEADGLWLTERVWEPDLVGDLADAGVRYAFVDDRHFLVAGHPRHMLHRPHVTESGGRTVTLLPIDERLRYLVPFRPVAELERYFRTLRAEGHPLAILADDGEKFGGWPGTAEWVWQSGWIEDFLAMLTRTVEDEIVEIVAAGTAVEEVAARGPAYLPSGSYREMEAWSLPAPAAAALETFEGALASLDDTLGAMYAADVAARFVRGGHWRNFLSTYPESGRMHRKARLLAELAAAGGPDASGAEGPDAARRALGRARCNDPYWHGVFGGLYLRHLREAVWANLAEAEELLRAGEPLALELVRDEASGGGTDLWIHSDAFSCLLSPARGGAVMEWTLFGERRNLADVLTRRWEAYHRLGEGEAGADAGVGGPDAAESIHAAEAGLSFRALPPFDLDDRTLTVERVLPEKLDEEAYARADYEPIRSWARDAPDFAYEAGPESVGVGFSFDGPGALEKQLTVHADGALEITYRWDPGDFPPGAWFAPELSLSRPVDIETSPEASEIRRYEIRTVSKSERGAEETVQGFSITPMWPCASGEARLRMRP